MFIEVLCVALALLIVASALPGRYRRYRFLIGAAGWFFFAMHWALQPVHYIEINDYINVVLVLAVAVFCLIIAHAMLRNYMHYEDVENTLLTITTAAALGGLFYYPFAEIELLNTFLISASANQVVYILHLFNIPAELIGWNQIELNGHHVRIILACTAIESIAIFIGLIFCVRASAKRTLIAFTASIPVIYLLNLVRNVFVVVATGYDWFGEHTFRIADHVWVLDSFDIAHNYIAKLGSGIALFVIAYVVMQSLPELLDVIDRVVRLLRAYVKGEGGT
ncbi:archaeosortase A [Methanosarcinales archaeon]|nr:MAG: archaeosortase A [Methanosarcinales archaeon]